jgi:predicted nuclease of restriction endonuclease-like (RecB) superfamily
VNILAGANYDWTAIKDKIANGEGLWDTKKKKKKVSDPYFISAERDRAIRKKYNMKYDIPYEEAERLSYKTTGTPFQKAMQKKPQFEGATGFSGSGQFDIAAKFGETAANPIGANKLKSEYNTTIMKKYSDISNYEPKVKIVKYETDPTKLTTMDKFKYRPFPVFGEITNLKKPKTVYQYKAGNLKDPVTGVDVETIFEDMLQLNVVAEDSKFYYYRSKDDKNKISSVSKDYVHEKLPDLEEQKIRYMESQINSKKNVATMADKISFNVGEGMRRMAFGGEVGQKYQIPTGSKAADLLSDVGGEILGFATPTGAAATGMKIGKRIVGGGTGSLGGAITEIGEKAVGGLTNLSGKVGRLGGVVEKASNLVNKNLTSGLGKSVVEGAAGMGAYTALENTEGKSSEDRVKNTLKNMFLGGVFNGTFYGVSKGAVKLAKVWKLIPDTPETLNLVEASKNEYLNAYDNALKADTLAEQTKLANEAGDTLYENISKISGKYKSEIPTGGKELKVKNTQLEQANKAWEEAVDTVQNRFRQKELTVEEQNAISSELGINTDELIANMEKAEKEGKKLSSYFTSPQSRRAAGIYKPGETERLTNLKEFQPANVKETTTPTGIEPIPGKVETTTTPTTASPIKTETPTTALPSKEIEAARMKKDELQSRLDVLLSSKTAPSKEVETEVANIKKMIKDIDLQMFGSGGAGIPYNPANPNMLKTKEHIVSSASTKTSFKEGFNKMYKEMIDRNRSLQLVSRLGGKESKTAAADSPWKMANIAASYEGIAKSNIEQYVADRTGKKVGEGLSTILKEVPKGKKAELDDYMLLKLASQLKKRNPDKSTVYPKEWGVTAQDMDAKLLHYEQNNPTFKKFAAKFNKYNDDLVKTQLVDSGLLSKDQFKAMKAENPFYIPNRRLMKDVEQGKNVGTSASYTGQGSQIKGRVGSERQSIDPTESMLMNTFNYAKAAKRNEVAQTLAKMAEKDPEKLKPFLEIVEKNRNEAMNRNINMNNLDDFVDEVNAGFEIGKVQNLNKPNIVTYRVDGKVKHMMIKNAELLDNLTYLNTDQINSFVETVRKGTNSMKTLTTGINPMFGIARNIWRDVVTSYVQSKTLTKVPVANLVQHLTDLVGSFIGSTFKTQNYKEYRAMGGGFFSSAIGTDKDLLAETVAKYAGSRTLKGKAANLAKAPIKKPIQVMEWFNNTLETLPRYAEYSRTVKQMTKKGADEYTAKLQGIYNGQEVTVNFKRSGEFAKGADAFVPYFNAAIQGIDKTIRTLDPRNPAELANVISKGVTGITVPALMLYAVNHDNKDYNQLSDYIKDNNFLIPYGRKGEFIKIPKPREFGVIFGSLPERIARQFVDKDPKAWKNFVETIKQNFMPPDILKDNLSAPYVRNVMSEEGRTWRGTPVVPQYLLNRSPGKQYDDNTSAIAKFLGEKIKFAPKKIDELMKSYLGGVAQLGIPATSKRALNEKGVINAAIEVLKKQVTADSKYSTDIADTFYKNMKNVSMKKADMDAEGKLKGKGETYIDAAGYVFNKASKQVSDLRSAQREAKTNEEKDKIQVEMNKVMTKINEDYSKNYLKKSNMTTIKRKREFKRAE